MGQILHAIQHSQESLKELAKRYDINQRTVAKWKKRTLVVYLPTGPIEPKSTILSRDNEAIIVAFRRHMLAAARRLPLKPSCNDPASDAIILARREDDLNPHQSR